MLPELLAAIRESGDDRLLRAAEDSRRALDAAPNNAEASYTLGMIAHGVGKLEIAAGLMETAAGLAPERIDFIGNLGNVYQDMGRHDGAIECYRRVIEAAPLSEMAYNNLGNTLQEMGELEEAAVNYRWAVELQPEFVAAWSNLGITLNKMKRSEDAVAAFEHALRIKPDFTEALLNLGTAHRDAGDSERAIDCFNRVLEAQPGSAMASNKLQEIHLDRGEYGRAEELALKLRRVEPGNQMAVACEAFARLARRDMDGFDYLYGGDGLLHAEMPQAPEGFADTAALNDALAAELLSHRSLKWIHDRYETSKRGFVYGVLDRPEPALAAFGDMLHERLDAFIAGLARDPDHPFFGAIPEKTTLNLWATILTGSGHHPSHLHERNWLGGTYYVRVPAACRADDPSHAGWIEFDGFTQLPGLDEHRNLVRRVTPVEGLLVLFPAYLMHQTAAFEGDDMRIGLSFDLVPG